jgi:hypothetical protein
MERQTRRRRSEEGRATVVAPLERRAGSTPGCRNSGHLWQRVRVAIELQRTAQFRRALERDPTAQVVQFGPTAASRPDLVV